MAQSGYSGTPLVKKLGIKEGARIFLKEAPEDYLGWIEPLPSGIRILKRPGKRLDFAHVFVTKKKELKKTLKSLFEPVRPDGMIWVSWHKKSSKIPTEITEDVIREVALPMGLVDIKVCAVSEIWSGLKLVIRKELR